MPVKGWSAIPRSAEAHSPSHGRSPRTPRWCGFGPVLRPLRSAAARHESGRPPPQSTFGRHGEYHSPHSGGAGSITVHFGDDGFAPPGLAISGDTSGNALTDNVPTEETARPEPACRVT